MKYTNLICPGKIKPRVPPWIKSPRFTQNDLTSNAFYVHDNARELEFFRLESVSTVFNGKMFSILCRSKI